MMMATLPALGFSACLLFFLCAGDPKRRRSAHTPGKGQGKTQRRLFSCALCLPVLAFALHGDAAAFMMWLGGTASMGWLAALAFSRHARP